MAADFSRPAGTFYYVPTSDPNRSGPRDANYDTAVTLIRSLGGTALKLPVGTTDTSVLPDGHQDCLGVMTGWATPAILTTNMTLLPGDIILTGTPSGVGPIESGDRLEVRIQGLSPLVNQVK